MIKNKIISPQKHICEELGTLSPSVKQKRGGVDVGRILNDPQKGYIHSMVQHLNWAQDHDPKFTKEEAKYWKNELRDELKEAGL